MKFKFLQDGLREALWRRIEAGEVTGLQLAKEAGFKQAHISNFLNRKRGLSIEAMDRVLSAQHLSILDLLDPKEVTKRAGIPSPANAEFQDVPLVDEATAVNASIIMRMKVKEILKFRRDFLHQLRPAMESSRNTWERFVAIKLHPRERLSMYPRLLPGATLLIDRYYNSLKPYRKGESNIYAVAHNGHCKVRYVELDSKHLILRPQNQDCAVELVPLLKNKHAFDHIVGRVCYVGLES
jgi:hypothetical protein